MFEACLVLLAILIGAVGTLVGAGGGFVLAPILLVLQPALRADQLAAVTLAVVFVNASVGSISYWLRGRVDVRSAFRFAAVAIPASILGVFVNQVLPRALFAAGLGAVLLVGGVLLVLRPAPPSDTNESATAETPPATHLPWGPSVPHRRGLGMVIAALVGFLSSLLGIGGGILHVPILVRVLRFPVHSATATSHFVLAMTSGVAVCIHLAANAYAGHWPETCWLALGVVIGAPIGARLSRLVHGTVILRTLGLALLAVGLRTLIAALA
jgi:uncharacterized membrane protein YfcA